MTLKRDFRELYEFLINPSGNKFTQKSTINILKSLLRLYIIEFIALVLLMSVILFITDTSTNMISNLKNENTGFRLFLLIVILVPLVEELIFRLPLIFRPAFLGISSGLLMFMLLGRFLPDLEILSSEEIIFYQVPLSISIAFLIYYLSKKKKEIIQGFYMKNLKFLVWFTIIFFAFFHIANFNFSEKHLLLIPFLTLPQIVSGIILTYTRLHYGFIYAVVYHSFGNLIIYSI